MVADMAIFRTTKGTGRINAADLNAEMRTRCDICGKPRNRGDHDRCSKQRQAKRREMERE